MSGARLRRAGWALLLRGGALVLAVAGTETALLRWLRPVRLLNELRQTTPTFEELLVAVCATAAVTACGWLLLVTLIEVGRAVAHGVRTGSAPSTGALVRRILLLAFGAALTTGLAGPALAQPHAALDSFAPRGAPVAPTGRAADAVAPLAGLALPERTVGVRSRDVAWLSVEPGDSLWTLAERLLAERDVRVGAGTPPEPNSVADIAAAVHALHRHNRARIGDDADLILPGQRLAVPDSLVEKNRR